MEVFLFRAFGGFTTDVTRLMSLV